MSEEPRSFGLKPLEWRGDAESGVLALLDQRALPLREQWVECRNVKEVARAIRDMTVRGAPAIGVAAAYGITLAARAAHARRAATLDAEPLTNNGALKAIEHACKTLAATRPTAVNLFWALNQCLDLARALHREGSLQAPASAPKLLDLALKIHEDDIAGNLRMSEFGAARIESGMGILTHCNAGALATGGVGTALGVIAMAHAQGKKIHVYADETRPRLQGARLTAWELSKLGVPYTLICDNMAASLMARGKIQMCVTGADRIASNGDTANKIGTYSVAVNAHHHKIPFYVAAPRSTFDLSIPGGAAIPIEERHSSEVHDWGGERTCPQDTRVFNPGFDVTPAPLIRAIFTERGEIAPVNSANIAAVLDRPVR